MDANKGVYYDIVQQAEAMGSQNENLDIIERGMVCTQVHWINAADSPH